MKLIYFFVVVLFLGVHGLYASSLEGLWNYFRSFFDLAIVIPDDTSLSFEQCFHLLKKEFENVNKADDFKIEIMALALQGYTYKEILEIISMMKVNATKESGIFTMKTMRDAILFQLYQAAEHEDKNLSEQEKLYRAYHESCHVLMVVMQDEFHMVFYTTIQGRAHTGGHMKTLPLAPESMENHSYYAVEARLQTTINTYLAGGIGEQLFDIPASAGRTYENFASIDKDSEDYDYLECVSRVSVNDDIVRAWDYASSLIRMQHGIDLYENVDENWLADQIKVFLKVSYAKTKLFLMQHKDKIEKLAHLLALKEIVFADELYAVCGKARPKFYFEK